MSQLIRVSERTRLMGAYSHRSVWWRHNYKWLVHPACRIVLLDFYIQCISFIRRSQSKHCHFLGKYMIPSGVILLVLNFSYCQLIPCADPNWQCESVSQYFPTSVPSLWLSALSPLFPSADVNLKIRLTSILFDFKKGSAVSQNCWSETGGKGAFVGNYFQQRMNALVSVWDWVEI